MTHTYKNLLLVISLVAVFTGGYAVTTTTLRAGATPSVEEEALIATIAKALPSVVSVVGIQEQNGIRSVVSRGSGFFATKDGLVFTNRHVVEAVGVTYRVFLADGRRFTVDSLAIDPLNDIAILKIKGTNFQALPFADSDKLSIGATVLTIGNSLGQYQNSVTRGVVSGLNRSLSASNDSTGSTENYEDAIQTDAAINPGNSGGPLINSRGEVVGINSAVNRQGNGVGFAVPINNAAQALKSYQKHGRIVRPYVGVRYLTVTPDIQEEKRLAQDYGALVSAGDIPAPAVLSGSPADKAGLKENDVILTVNGVLVRGQNTLKRMVGKFNPGETLTLLVNRGGKIVTISLTLSELDTKPTAQ